MEIRISDLRAFLASSESSSFSHAGALLGISQPAISESIKRLEEVVGSKLFYRSKLGISLTPTGTEYLERAKGIVERIETFRDLKLHEQTTRFRIGVHGSVAQYLIPKAMLLLESSAAAIDIQLIHRSSRQIQLAVQNAEIDLGVVINPSFVPDMIIKLIGHDFVRVWANSESTVHHRIIYDPDLIQSQHILRKWNCAKLSKIETSSLELICALTNSGFGMGIIPERVVKIHAPNLQTVEGSSSFSDSIGMIYRPEFGKSESERALIACFKNALN